MKPETITQMAVDYARSVGEVTRYVIDAYTKGFNVGYEIHLDENDIQLREKKRDKAIYHRGLKDGETDTLRRIKEDPRNILWDHMRNNYKVINIFGFSILIKRRPWL